MEVSKAYVYHIEVDYIGRANCYLEEFRKGICIRRNTIHFKSRKAWESCINLLSVKGVNMIEVGGI